MIVAALKFFRQCINLQDDFWITQLIQNHLFAPILNIVYETMPRDNLLNSVCLELFELIKRENIKPLINHLVETYREKLQEITYVETFQNIVLRYDQMQNYNAEQEAAMAAQDGELTPTRGLKVNGHQRWQGLKEDAAEEAYFNTSDDEDELAATDLKSSEPRLANGASPLMKSLVDYPDDDFEDAMDTTKTSQQLLTPLRSSPLPDPGEERTPPKPSPPVSHTPPERLSEKRRRQEDDEEDMLGKLSQPKRRTPSMSSIGSTLSNGVLRRKKGFSDRNRDSSGGAKKIEISLGAKRESSSEREGDEGG